MRPQQYKKLRASLILIKKKYGLSYSIKISVSKIYVRHYGGNFQSASLILTITLRYALVIYVSQNTQIIHLALDYFRETLVVENSK